MANRLIPVTLAGAAAVAALALFGGAQPGGPATPAASGPSGTRIVNVDDNGGVNDNGQTSGDIFTQNAQDQSTASGAGT
ncbi:hypothetical protein [Mycobacterium montefiorense]|uniref:Secreted protein n=1 Tax=Mycobacterium montefiorense TaxID=154654 RepID=A0AA37PLS1_9MYCO|nr:hypothetical protein [Mycobacterium montefiorense]GBG40299.1 hypothetical protein MmonteBS_46710 [Mycobacterium montefiorense]GKU35176.1 hypothetical protein NJB14191_25220 [Mycobacterium montefiorense]GKU40130.1 hypothetical protein NJB14192_21170 [Mycobacterium montefiorense]GKU46069.1 hypothetical protein NJB14194_26890 [Mycobacterium montefiorense]GKU52941.1 hypothetical protein NJB14195_41820 [Mycobacterium montefiorense]